MATEPKDAETDTTPKPKPRDAEAARERDDKPKRLPFWVEPTGLAVIKRAVQLRLATMGEVTSDDAELHGAALVAIVSAWMQAEAERLRAVRA